jgi:adenylate cyclase class 2
MAHLNIEIKARTNRLEALHQLLLAEGAREVGVDHQIDTYFVVPKGRLKLREGNIEHTLIHYHRPDQSGAKNSDVALFHPGEQKGIKEVLERALEVKVVVDKVRRIYFIENVKFHLDKLDGLGTFVEIEAIDMDGTLGETYLHQQCTHYIELLGIQEDDLIDRSYSDLLLEGDKTKS